jgi:hypothetical protein
VPARASFDYAVIRVVPSVARGEFFNAGVIVHCRARDFLEARVALDIAALRALAPEADADEVLAHLSTIPLICAGAPEAGPIGALSQPERFHWLVAPRSTIIQPSAVHSGLCDDPRGLPDRLLATMVLRAKRTR